MEKIPNPSNTADSAKGKIFLAIVVMTSFAFLFPWDRTQTMPIQHQMIAMALALFIICLAICLIFLLPMTFIDLLKINDDEKGCLAGAWIIILFGWSLSPHWIGIFFMVMGILIIAMSPFVVWERKRNEKRSCT